MTRRPRVFGSEVYHHIYAWGNDRRPLFIATPHYKKYLHYLQQYGKWYRFDVIAYALMEWHVHLFVFDQQGKISMFMNSVHGRYAQYFNHVTGRVGHVFGERYNNKIVQSNPYGMWLSRYIHRQPVEAGLTDDPQEYAWSSYRAYLGLEPRGFIKPDVVLEQFGRGKSARHQYKIFVETDEPDPVNWEDRLSNVVGDKNFIEAQEVKIRRDAGEIVSPDYAFKRVKEKLGVHSDVLARPHGMNQRKIRHKVFKILVEEYGLSCSQIARLCKVSASAVAKVMRKER